MPKLLRGLNNNIISLALCKVSDIDAETEEAEPITVKVNLEL